MGSPIQTHDEISLVLDHHRINRLHHVRRRRCGIGHRQWLRHVQGRLRWGRRPQGRVPLHRGTPPSPGCDGGYGSKGLLCRRRGPVQEGYPHPEVPCGARNHHQLGRHGEDLAPHLLQRAPCCPRGAARPPHRGPPQPQGQQGEDDPDHVRDLQHARHVRGHPGRALPVRLRPYHRHRDGLRRRCLPRRPRLRGLRSPPRHRPSGPGWPRAHQLPDEDPHREGLLLHHHCREGDCPWHQGEALLRRPGLRAGDVHCRRLHLPGEVLRAARRPGHHHRQREVQVPRGSLPAQLPGHGGLRHPRDHLHLHHEDQDHRSPREEVLRLDRRLHPGFPLHLPADVDLQAGVRRVRPIHCPPQALLSASQLPRKKNNILDPIATTFIYLSVRFSLLFYSTTLPLPFGRLTLFSSIRLSITFLLQL